MRFLPTWAHNWEPLEMAGESTLDGVTVSTFVRRTKICTKCGATHPFRMLPCRR